MTSHHAATETSTGHAGCRLWTSSLDGPRLHVSTASVIACASCNAPPRLALHHCVAQQDLHSAPGAGLLVHLRNFGTAHRVRTASARLQTDGRHPIEDDTPTLTKAPYPKSCAASDVGSGSGATTIAHAAFHGHRPSRETLPSPMRLFSPLKTAACS